MTNICSCLETGIVRETKVGEPLVCSLASKEAFSPKNRKLTFKKYIVTSELIGKERIDDSRHLKR